MRRLFQWVKDNPNRAMFLVPILLVAGISISHVVSWYDIANPINWAIYLSIAIEVAAMTALVAATNRIKGGVWFMFILVTIIQMIGNIFFSFKEIDANGDLFKSWVELTGPLWEMLGSDPTDISSQKRWLAFLEGGLLPIISLTSLHFFTKYDRNKPEEKEEVLEKTSIISEPDEDLTDIEYNDIVREFVKKQKEEADKLKYTPNEEDLKKLDDFLSKVNYDGPKKDEVDESVKFTPNEDELKKIEEFLSKYSKPEPIEIKEENNEDLVSNDTDVEVITNESNEEENVEEIQIQDDLEYHNNDETKIETPNIIEEPKVHKVLNYFKNNG
jgi:hypothetical protein